MAIPDTEHPRHMSRLVEAGRRHGVVEPLWRPRTRGECLSTPRPCPYVGCRYNLALDVTESGGIKYRQSDSLEDMLGQKSNCALDIAADGPMSREEVSSYTGVDVARIGQIEQLALSKLAQVEGLERPGSIPASHHEGYTRPEDRDMTDALGIDEDNAWARKAWRKCLQEEQWHWSE